MQETLGVDFPGSAWAKHLRPKTHYTGPSHQWCGLSKGFWGKFLYIASGERLVAGVPITFFAKDVGEGATLGDISDKLKGMGRADVVQAGGFWAYLSTAQAVVCPPGYLLADINRGAMVGDAEGVEEDDDLAQSPVDVIAPCQYKLKRHYALCAICLLCASARYFPL